MPDDYAASTATTGAVTVGGSATGNIEASRDVDWFAVALVAGRTYVIDLEGAAAGGGTLTDTLLFGVFDDEGSRLSRKSRDGGEGGDARIVFTATETGTHYIAAKGARKDDAGTYTVRVSERDPAPVVLQQQTVPTNVDADATTDGAADLGGLAGERLARRDSVDGGDDAVDYYRFTLSETQVVTLRLRQQDANADLYLEDGDGTVLHSSTRDGTRGENITAALQAGTYYVRVAAQEAGDNDYLLRARAEDPVPAPQTGGQNTPLRQMSPSSQDNGVTLVAANLPQSGGGNDKLADGGGNDLLIGGPGSDIFVFGPGNYAVTVRDFTDGKDRIDLRAFTAITGFSAVDREAVSGGVEIDLSAQGGGTVLLQGFALANLDPGDFLFHG